MDFVPRSLDVKPRAEPPPHALTLGQSVPKHTPAIWLSRRGLSQGVRGALSALA